MENNLENKLNLSQKRAIEHSKGPLLIIAGAGTGKTTVITERIKNLIQDKKVRPEEILALTFTEKAAGEMLDRLDVIMPLSYEEPWIMTFHGFCDRILRDEGLEIGLSTDYKILDQPNQWILIKKNLFDLGLKYYLPLGNPTKFIGALLKFFSRLQDEDIMPEDFFTYVKKFQASSKLKAQSSKLKNKEVLPDFPDNPDRLWELANAYKKYQEIKLKENHLDFGDLITWTLRLFRERPNILKKYQQQFKHILVDEFQDTNWAQLQLVKLLAPAKDNPNLVVVGDDDQSIYKWRGAAVSNILDFKKHYPNASEVVLIENYRSGQKLLNTTYRLIINNNPDRLEVRLGIDKKLKAKRGSFLPLPEIVQLPSLEDEADFVAGKIMDLASRENYTYKDFAILARANNHLDPFITAFKRHGIPYQLLGNRGLFDQDEVRDLLFFGKAVVDPKDSINLFQVLHNPVFKIETDKILEALVQSRGTRKSLWEVINKKSDTEEKFLNVVNLIKSAREKTASQPTSRILFDFVQQTGYVKQFIETETLENQLKIKNLNLFFQKIKSFESENKKAGLVEFIDWLDLLIEAGENPAQAQIEDIDTVFLATVHGVKGLEFPVVFVVNCVADRFPTRRRNDSIEFPEKLIKESLPEGDSHLQEERRLFYVACTRARDYLFLTLAKDYGGAREKRPSIFLHELKLSINQLKTNPNQLSWLNGVLPINVRPKKVIDGKPYLSFVSYSQIDTFLTCPLKYKYRYVLSVPSRPHHSLTFGQTIHRTLREFHLSEKLGKLMSMENFLQVYERNFDEAGYESEEHKLKRYNEGKKFLANYYRVHKELFPGSPFLLEQSFNLRIGNIPLQGKIDRIDKTETGYELIDYKTGSSKDQKIVDKDRQLTIYAMAAVYGAMRGQKIMPEKLSLYFIEENKKITTTRSNEELEKEKKLLVKTIDSISKSKFPAKPGYPFPCSYCEYNIICPFAKKG